MQNIKHSCNALRSINFLQLINSNRIRNHTELQEHSSLQMINRKHGKYVAVLLSSYRKMTNGVMKYTEWWQKRNIMSQQLYNKQINA